MKSKYIKFIEKLKRKKKNFTVLHTSKGIVVQVNYSFKK